MSKRIALGLGLLAAIAAVYAQVRTHQFVGYDDIPQVVRATDHCIELSVDAALGAFVTPQYANWVPLTNLSHQLDCSLFGAKAAPYLLENVGLHGLCTLLLFALLLRLTGALGPSAFVAGVFALHPLHVESVAWASGRRDLLCGVFWMLCLLAYARYVQRPNVARYTGVVAALVLALLAKPMAVTLPFVLLLLDYWPLRRMGDSPSLPQGSLLRSAILEKLPLFAIVAAISGLTYRVQGDGGNLILGPSLGLSERLANVVVSYASYIFNSFWPTNLAVFYPFPIGGHPSGLILGAALLLIAVSVAALWTVRGHPYLLVGWLWYLGTLVPVVGFVQTEVQASADRYTYLPQIGLTIALAWGVASLLPRTRAVRAQATAVGSAALLALALLSWQQTRYWSDSVALFSRAVAVTEGNHVAHYNLGVALRKAGESEQGILHQEIAQDIEQRRAQARAEGR